MRKYLPSRLHYIVGLMLSAGMAAIAHPRMRGSVFDYLIKNGVCIDGSGRRRERMDVALTGDRIAAIGLLAGAQARRVIDADGCIIAPGFIDVHNHDEAWLLKDPHFDVKFRQGFTCEILMSDGISYAPINPATAPGITAYWRAINGLEPGECAGWSSLADYMRLLDRRMPTHALPLVPYANLRIMAKGWGADAPDAAQAAQIAAGVDEGMRAGAAGLSVGMDYVGQCFASTAELVEVCRSLRAHDGLLVMHIRYALGRLEALKEAVRIGRQAGVAVHISHLMGRSVQESATLLDYIDRVAVQEVDFSFDSIPYCSASTLLSSQLPIQAWDCGPSGALGRMRDPALRRKLAANLEALNLENYHIAWIAGGRHDYLFGQPLARYIAERDEDPADAVLNLLAETELAVLMVYRYGAGDAPAWPFLAHRCCMLGSDGIWFPQGQIHPRMYGSAARMIGDLVRRKLFTLEQAVHVMTGRPAARFGLRERGLLAAGHFADVVVFDSERVRDLATYEEPRLRSEGIEQVWVNGCPVVSGGHACRLDSFPGRALRYGRKE